MINAQNEPKIQGNSELTNAQKEPNNNNNIN